MLCAPAVIIMLAVAAYPIVYAVWLSLQRYDLPLPEPGQVHRLRQLRRGALARPYWWHALWVTVVITVVSVAIELVLGMALAL